jgi:uncharacterized membrane protein
MTNITLPPRSNSSASERILSIDVLRGLMMVIMALDHVRDFFSNAQFDPLNLAQTNPALFFTRWITHFCAPTFVLLAGVSISLYGLHKRRKAEVARYLLIRGFILVVLEFTLVHLGWFFSFQTDFLLAQVIWMLGWCMIALAGLIFLPRWLVISIGIAMIAGHNLLDNVSAANFGAFEPLWIILHQGGMITLARGHDLFILYPLVPWIGVMALGYALAPILLLVPDRRRRWLLLLGIGLTIGFVVLRGMNIYGDPVQWSARSTAIMTALSFLNTDKYPPSLLYLLMTLEPACLLLAAFDRLKSANRFAQFFRTFGQVPLFYYVIHLMLIHAIAVVFSLARYGDARWLFGTAWMFRSGLPRGYGYDLAVVYGIWLLVIVILYPICWWYARVKQRNRGSWLRYF